MADTFISVDHHGALQNKSQYLAGIKDRTFQPEEIAHFMKMISKTSKHLSAEETQQMKDWLVKNAPKH